LDGAQGQVYEFLFDDMGTDEVVAIDCETTGLNPKKDDIVSIAAVTKPDPDECFHREP
jgi:DNA polymerase-3 subunit epsilon